MTNSFRKFVIDGYYGDFSACGTNIQSLHKLCSPGEKSIHFPVARHFLVLVWFVCEDHCFTCAFQGAVIVRAAVFAEVHAKQLFQYCCPLSNSHSSLKKILHGSFEGHVCLWTKFIVSSLKAKRSTLLCLAWPYSLLSRRRQVLLCCLCNEISYILRKIWNCLFDVFVSFGETLM